MTGPTPVLGRRSLLASAGSMAALGTLGVLSTGSGASAQAVDPLYVQQDAQVWNAKDHGVIGDAVTDDTSAINGLISRVHTAGAGVVYFPPGRYKFTGNIVPSSNVDIIGAGSGKTVFLPTGFSRGFFKQSTEGSPLTDVTFADFEIDGSGQVRPGMYDVLQAGIRVDWNKRCKFRDLYVHDTAATAIAPDYPINLTISNCVVERGGRLAGTSDAGGSGIGISVAGGTSKPQPMIILNNIVTDCRNFGILLEAGGLNSHATEVVISNNLCVGNRGGICDAGLQGAIIANNVCRANTQDGIVISGGTILFSTGVQTAITDNQCHSNGSNGIRLSMAIAEPGRYHISGNGCWANRQSGISCNLGGSGTVRGIVISDNLVYSNFQSGIVFTGTKTVVEWVQIHGNVVFNNCFFGGSGGIAIAASIKSLSIRFNTCYDEGGTSGCQPYGVALGSGFVITNGIISDNDLRGNKSDGYHDAGASLIATPVRNNEGMSTA